MTIGPLGRLFTYNIYIYVPCKGTMGPQVDQGQMGSGPTDVFFSAECL